MHLKYNKPFFGGFGFGFRFAHNHASVARIERRNIDASTNSNMISLKI